MLNHVILVGRLVQTPVLQVTDSGKKVSSITLAVPRSYKNQNGEYDTDFLDCTLWTGIAESTAEYCKTGDVIGVKGRMQTRMIEKDDGSKYKRTEIIAEKVTFLSSNGGSKSINSENSEEEEINCSIEEDTDKKETKVAKKKK